MPKLQNANGPGRTVWDECGWKQKCRLLYVLLKNGAFTANVDMDGMIDICAPIMVQENPSLTEEAARNQMQKFFQTLKRWKKN